MTQPQVLVVENEMIVALDLELCLRTLGCNVAAVATTGEEAVGSARQLKPDVVLMDIRLEGQMDGIQAAERIRKEMNVPLIFLTAAGDNQTIARAVLAEPSGYLIKPFDERELAAAILLALHKRRAHEWTRAVRENTATLAAVRDTLVHERRAHATSLVRIGDLSLDYVQRRVFLDQNEISLTKKEFEILRCLAQRSGVPLSPEAILTEVWGAQFGHYVQTLRVHIGHIRKKLSASSCVTLEAVRGVGYRLIENRWSTADPGWSPVGRASSDLFVQHLHQSHPEEAEGTGKA